MEREVGPLSPKEPRGNSDVVTGVLRRAVRCTWPAAFAALGAAAGLRVFRFHKECIPYLVTFGIAGVCARLGDPIQRIWDRRFRG